MFVADETAERLEHLARWAADGDLAAAIERTFSLDEVPEAMRHLGNVGPEASSWLQIA